MPDDPAPTLDLAAIEARCAAATPGPWYTVADDEFPDIYALLYGANNERSGDVFPDGWLASRVVACGDAAGNPSFISHAREDVPALVALVRRLKAENSELRAEQRKLQTRLWNKLAGVDVDG